MTGTLFVVATPIGNLEDLTFRALRTLREVDLIAAEDTRRTAKLLAHYEIRKPLVSLREHNETRETPRLLDRIASGESVALVSDAGTPTIADPGARLVRAAHDRQLRVVPIPGPSALVTALSVSGFTGEHFVFMGFPPRSGSQRKAWLDALEGEHRVVVFFEAPHRIRRTLSELVAILGNRQIMVARELTKKFEELAVRPDSLVESHEKPGEFTVVVDSKPSRPQNEAANDQLAVRVIGCLTNNGTFSEEDATRIASEGLLMTASEIRKAIKKHKILADRQKAASS